MDWPNLFAIKRFCYIEVLFHILCYFWGKEYICYTKDFVKWIEVCYIKVSPYCSWKIFRCYLILHKKKKEDKN